MTPKEVLQSARDLIANVGWCQIRMKKMKASVSVNEPMTVSAFCMVGAMQEVKITDDHKVSYQVRDKAYDVLRSLVFEEVGNKHYGINQWNDEKNRTVEQVLEMFDRAIIRCQ